MDEKDISNAGQQRATDYREKIVQFEGFRCMAYLDEYGKWRAVYGGEELTGFIRIVTV